MRGRPHIVLLPGLDGSGQFFGQSLDYFRAHGPTHVLPLPLSGPQDYTSLADNVLERLPKLDPFVLVAESFSGPIAIELAARPAPGLVGLMLVASFAGKPLGRFSPVAARVSSFGAYVPVAPAFIINWLLLNQSSSSLASDLRRYLVGCDREILNARAKSALTVSVENQLKHLKIPVAALVAKNDRLLLHPEIDRDMFPNVVVSSIDGAHFLLQTGDRDQLTAAIDSFFRVVWSDVPSARVGGKSPET